MKGSSSRVLRAASAAIAALLFGGTLLSTSPATAAFHSPGDFNRAQVAMRANAWVSYRVPYSQTRWLNGYRQDCSGFVSMAWGLRKSYVTWTLPQVAWPIHKSDLTMGDIMLNLEDHVVIFDKWANKQQTAYWEWELAGSTGRPVHRVVPYPFWTADRDKYKPYRFAVSPYYTGKQQPKPKAAQAPTSSPVATAPVPPARNARKTQPPAPARAAARPKPAAEPRETAVKRTPPKPAPAAKSAAPLKDRKETTAEQPLVLTLLRNLVAWLAD